MTIPKTIKIGGKVYAVEVTDKLYLGIANASAEILYDDLIIRVAPQARGKMEADLLHEVVHGILNHLGYRDHDEKKVDELAQALYMVVQDNPDLFDSAEEDTRLDNFCPGGVAALKGGEGVMTREEAIRFAKYAQIIADGKPDVQEFYKLAEAALREQEEQRWILTAEKLPDCEDGHETKPLFFVTRNRTIEAGYFGKGGTYRDKYFRRYSDRYEGYDASDIVCWMWQSVLPEPPKEVQGNADTTD